MHNNFDTTLIITTYNWPEALRLTLISVLSQSLLPGEVIIADDGSRTDTEDVIKEVLGASNLKWSHVRHEDNGVRQSRIKNLAVKHTSYSYLIFIDQDVVIHQDFIADHLFFARAGCFLQGKRVLLPERYTRNVIEEGVFRTPGIMIKGLGNRKNLLRFPLLGIFFSRPKRFESSLRGCNLSMFKSDFLDVDGFDEVFDRSWGREDSDICYRLYHRGIRVRNLWFMALQYHLKHRVYENWDKERLDSELDKNVRTKRIKAEHGFSKLSDEGGIVASSHKIR